MIPRTPPIVRSVAATLVAYQFAQVAVFVAIGTPYGFSEGLFTLFFAVSVPSHAAFFALLAFLKDAFVIEATGERLVKVNLANRITLARLSSLPTILALIVAARENPIQVHLLALIAAVFVTDFVDGWVSRAKGQVTRIGRMLDSTSDYCLLIVLTVAFRVFGLIPDWVLACILVRLGFQVVAVATIWFVKGSVEPKTTTFGKVAIAAVMALYATELARHAFSPGFDDVFLAIEIAVSALVTASIADKAIALAKELRAKPSE